VGKLIFLVPAALFGVLLVVFSIGLTHDPHLLPSTLIDRPAPDFALPGLYDAAKGLSRKDLGGRITLVNFFASWCTPCREEHQELMALAQRQGVILEGIAYKDKPEDARRFLDALGNPFRRVALDREGRTAIDFGVYGVPETYVIDASGQIRYRQVGPLTAEDVQEKILPLLGQIKPSAAQPG
jgi:cytochrome c biogenesis protein CcmG, thiol:disulfide interchange protein DsbE